MCYFCGVHVHNSYSTLDGMGDSERFVKEAKKLGWDALGISNHGNVCGTLVHYQNCKDAGINPIIGSEVYFEANFDKDVAKTNKQRGGFSHLTLFAQNNIGYSNLMKITTEANQEENFYYKPIVSMDNLKRNRDGLHC